MSVASAAAEAASRLVAPGVAAIAVPHHGIATSLSPANAGPRADDASATTAFGSTAARTASTATDAGHARRSTAVLPTRTLGWHVRPALADEAGSRASTEERSKLQKPGIAELVRRFGPSISGVGVLALSLWILVGIERTLDWPAVGAAIAALDPASVATALVLTAFAYAALAAYEIVVLRSTGHRVPPGRAAVGGVIVQGLAQTTGFAMLVGTAVRLRLYRRHGLGLIDVATVQAVFTLTFALAAGLLAGVALALDPSSVAPLGIAAPSARAIGLGAVALIVAGLLALACLARPIRIRGRVLRAPTAGPLVAQMACAALDLAAASAVLWTLLPSGIEISFPALLAMFTVAVTLGVLSNVPAGLGVVDGTLLLLLQPGDGLVADVVAALLAFRMAYYLLPFLVAAALLAVRESRAPAGRMGSALRSASVWAEPALPAGLAAAAAGTGTLLLLSAASTTLPPPLEALSGAALPIAEFARGAQALIGAALLVIARGLHRRLEGARVAAAILVATGMAASSLTLDGWDEALLLGAILGVLLLTRASFYRRRPFGRSVLYLPRVIAVFGGAAACLWLVVALSGPGSAPATAPVVADDVALLAVEPEHAVIGALLLVGLIGLWRAASPSPSIAADRASSDLERARAIVASHGAGQAWLALTGDKSFLFDRDGRAFLMYAVSGRSWVALGEPVGPPDAWPELLWGFREMVDRAGGRCVFYKVGPTHLPMILDLGLHPAKLGEAAIVDLAGFSVRGKGKQDLRSAQNRAAKQGYRFDVLPPEQVPAVLDELRSVSDAWLETQSGRDKGFSMGFFAPGYLAACPCAVVRDADGRVQAFANLWIPADGTLSGLDLMRFRPGAMHGTMDFLIVEALLWAKAQGYRQFDLGVAPLSGLPDHRLAPLWSRLARLAVRHGRTFYNFEGLRRFKEKYDPTWTPSYVLCPAWSLPRALADTASLIAGGWRGVISK